MRKVPRAPTVAFTHRANPLKILERCRFGLGYLISVEVKCRHSPQQKVSCLRTKPRKRAEFRSRYADIFGYALDFLLTKALQFRCRASSRPISVPLQNKGRPVASFFV